MYLVIFLTIWISCLSRQILANPVLLISLDGMRADRFDQYLLENPTSNFSQFILKGVKADYMTPSFPSLTFPNHFTLVTGLYPETHGIVSNTVYDPIYNQKVKLSKTPDAMWWNSSEPIWLTAKKQGLKTASVFWVGIGVWTRQPDILLEYSPKYELYDTLNELLSWMKKFKMDFTCIYFDEPDSVGHTYGPDGAEYKKKISDLDVAFGYLINGLKSIDIYEKLNIIIVSDHGMAKLNDNKFVLIQNYIDINWVDLNKTVFGVVSNIFPSSNGNLNKLYEAMKNIPNIKVYLKENIPDKFHYKNNRRIGPILAIAEEGFILTNEPYIDQEFGNHGFDNNLTSMRSIFMAQGPDFKIGKLRSFENVNVYPLMCKLLGIKCQPNNGTIDIFNSILINNSICLGPSKFILFFISIIKISFFIF